MCGIVALQLRDPALHGQLGQLMNSMLSQIVERGPDSAGLALYGDDELNPPGAVAVTLLDCTVDPVALAVALRPADARPRVTPLGETTLVTARTSTSRLEAAIEAIVPGAQVAGRGEHVAVLKGTGHPLDLATRFGLLNATGYQGVAHTRMATESAVTAGGAHPFTVADDLCLVHNGSFSNHATVRQMLRARGVSFDSLNDSEVAARYLAYRMRRGDDLTAALNSLGDVLDGFYTLVVTTPTSLAVVRDPIACKPAVIAQTPSWVAMASEYRALTGLPGIGSAHVFEPSPARVYTWDLSAARAQEAIAL